MNCSYRVLMICVALGSLLAWSGCGKTDSPSEAKESSAAPKETEKPAAPQTAKEILDRMAETYKKASSYSDFGTIHLVAEKTQGPPTEWKAEFSVKLERPNKLRLETNQGVLVTDGRQWNAYIRDLGGQVVSRDAPAKLGMDAIFADGVLFQALTRGFEGQIPELSLQSPMLVLLLTDDPLKKMLDGVSETALIEPGSIGGTDCYRIEARWPDGVTRFWIDQKTYVLRRMDFPAAAFSRFFGEPSEVRNVSVWADFTDAKVDAKIDPVEFQFQAPKDAQVVKMFMPPDYVQLLGKKAPELKLADLQGKPLPGESLAGKVVVLDFWATNCGPCREALPELDKVYQKYKDNGKVAFFAVSVDPAQVEAKALEDVAKELKLSIPVLRDAEQTAAQALRMPGIPAMFVLGSDGTIQEAEIGGTPDQIATMPDRIDKLLSGGDLWKDTWARYQDRVKQSEAMIDDLFQGKLAEETKTAAASPPTTFKLTKLWKSADVKSPGNIVTAPGPGGATRIFVVDQWQTIAEVDTTGKLIANYKPELQPKEVICNLRTAAGADGKRVYAAFALGYQRVFFFDEAWKPISIFPENALKNPHTGIADVELGDLDGDGAIKAYVGYYSATGVQGASLDGKRIWSNRTLASVVRTALTGPDAQGHRGLLCANESGSLALLDAKGEIQKRITYPDSPIGSIITADLNGDGKPLWCGLTANRQGQTVIAGLDPRGEILWSYSLPRGTPRQPIEPIIPGRLTASGPGQWILPGCDGSIHVVSADGKPIDKFNYGAVIGGIATVTIDGKPAMIVASENGLEAWRVD